MKMVARDRQGSNDLACDAIMQLPGMLCPSTFKESFRSPVNHDRCVGGYLLMCVTSTAVKDAHSIHLANSVEFADGLRNLTFSGLHM